MKVLRKYGSRLHRGSEIGSTLQIEGNHTYLVDHVVVHNSPETQPGGRALKFYSSQRLDIRRIETLKEGTEAVGNRVRVKVVKNKVAPPFRQAEFDIEYGVGISKQGGLLDMALEHDLIQKSGSFFSYGETRLGQGRNNTKEFLRDNPELAAELEQEDPRQARARRGGRGAPRGREGGRRGEGGGGRRGGPGTENRRSAAEEDCVEGREAPGPWDAPG